MWNEDVEIKEMTIFYVEMWIKATMINRQSY